MRKYLGIFFAGVGAFALSMAFVSRAPADISLPQKQVVLRGTGAAQVILSAGQSSCTTVVSSAGVVPTPSPVPTITPVPTPGPTATPGAISYTVTFEGSAQLLGATPKYTPWPTIISSLASPQTTATSDGTFTASVGSLTAFEAAVTTYGSGIVTLTVTCGAGTSQVTQVAIVAGGSGGGTPAPQPTPPYPVSQSGSWAVATTQNIATLTSASPTTCTSVTASPTLNVVFINSGAAQTNQYPQFYNEGATPSCSAADLVLGDGSSLLFFAGQVQPVFGAFPNGIAYKLANALTSNFTVLY